MPDSDTIHTLFTTTNDTIHRTTQKHTRMEIGTELNTTLTSQ